MLSCFHFSQAYVEYAQLEQNFDVSVTAEQKNQPFLLEDGARSVGSVLTYLVFYGILFQDTRNKTLLDSHSDTVKMYQKVKHI